MNRLSQLAAVLLACSAMVAQSLPKECRLATCLEGATCTDTRPQYCFDAEKANQQRQCTKWLSAHPRLPMPPKKEWKPAMCTVPRIRVDDAYLSFCEKNHGGSADCIAGCEQNQIGPWIGNEGAYLEVDDCSWHSGRNLREQP
jgi:hypothetical protein